MPPAARITDMHTCPMFNGPVPHVGGPIVGPSVPNSNGGRITRCGGGRPAGMCWSA